MNVSNSPPGAPATQTQPRLLAQSTNTKHNSAAAPAPQQTSSGRGHSHRSCVTCRKRKVRCDKKQPCQNCIRARIDCVFPSPDASGGRQGQVHTELLNRVKNFESMFKALVSCIGEEGINSALQNGRNGLQADGKMQEILNFREQMNSTNSNPPPAELNSSIVVEVQGQQESPPAYGSPAANNSPVGNISTPGDDASTSTSYTRTNGKLVQDNGRNTYDEVRGTLPEDSEYDNDCDSLDSQDSTFNHEFLFECGSRGAEPCALHPPQTQRLRAWTLFKENVHPVASLLHIPSIEPAVLEAMTNLHDVPRSIEVVMFVAYFGAVTSLSPDSCQEEFGEEQSVLLLRFRIGLQQALVKAKFMETDDIVVLQSFVLLLVLLRRHNPKLSWNLTGLAVRLAQSLGMHRDGSLFNLSKFDTEMRRRLWWNICLLDTPASEDHACSQTILEISSADARLPLNLNESDLNPSMTEYPSESEGMTDGCFFLARCTLNDMWRTMGDTRRYIGKTGKNFASMTASEREAWVTEQEKLLEQRFVRGSPATNPLHWVTVILTRCIICDIRLFIYNPLGSNVNLNQDERNRIFITAIECMEYSYRVRTDVRGRKWSWLLTCYHEWFALAVVLLELCKHPLGKNVDRAWRIIEQSVVLRWDVPKSHHKGSHQWRSIMKVLDKAREERKKSLQRRQSESRPPQQPQNLSPTVRSTPSVVQHPKTHHFNPPALVPQLPGETLLQTGESLEGFEALKPATGPLPLDGSLTSISQKLNSSQNFEMFSNMDLDLAMPDISSFYNFIYDDRYGMVQWREPSREVDMRLDSGDPGPIEQGGTE